MFKITIGGNIGCGKTTIIDHLAKNSKTPDVVFPEPIEKWGSWLDMFYVDPSKHAFPFQMKVLIDFMYFTNQHDDKTVVTERSPLDSLYIFCKTLLDVKHMSYMEYNLFKEYVDHIGWKPNVYIYLKTSSAVCVQRIRDRARNCETGIDPEYIEKIQYAYDNIVPVLESVYGIKVHVVDANRDKESVLEDVKRLLAQYDFLIS
jgi:deoxyadenosine/deoxycytidine kinase